MEKAYQPLPDKFKIANHSIGHARLRMTGVARPRSWCFLSSLTMLPCILLLIGCAALRAPRNGEASDGTWYFAVTGDSRNCGDIVMPTIAARVLEEKALFFWHLGDFRAASAIDQDFRMSDGSKPDYKTYRTLEWTDFKEQQLKAFGRLPVFLAPGNHETIPPDTRESYVQSFTDWLDTAVIKTQRLEDDPMDASVRPYYHWIKNGVDFLTLDNSSDDQFDAEQMRWFERVLAKARSSTSVKTIVLGMHEALPDSLAAGHSMNQYERQVLSGRIVYNELVKFRKDTGKRVYILASHSHFFMDNVYNTACRKATGIEVLPGWIIGTGGAVRYPLPADTSGSTQVITNVYGYLLAKVSFDGEISFAFKEVLDGDVPTAVKARYRDGDTVHACFTANRSTIVHFGPAVPPDCPQ